MSSSASGAYQDAQTKAYFEPFEKDTGIKIIQTSGVELAKLRAQVQSKNVEWDLLTIPDRQRYSAVHDGLLTKLDYSRIDTKDILPELVTAFAVGHTTVIMQLVYRRRISISPEKNQKDGLISGMLKIPWQASHV